MLKKRFLMILSLILILGIATGVGYIKQLTPNSKVIMGDANWVGQQDNIHNASRNSDVILIAKVTSHNSYEQDKVIFTDYNLDIDKVLKPKINNFSNIKVSLTGGDLNGTQYRLNKQQMLNDGDTYLFLLNKRYPNDQSSNTYSLIGGYQGAIKISSDSINGNKIYKGLPFNSDNILEKDLQQKDIIKELSSDI